MQTKSRAGSKQQDGLHGLQERAAILDSEFSARPVKIITANNKITAYSAFSQQDTEQYNCLIVQPFSFLVILEVQMQTQDFLYHCTSFNEACVVEADYKVIQLCSVIKK